MDELVYGHSKQTSSDLDVESVDVGVQCISGSRAPTPTPGQVTGQVTGQVNGRTTGRRSRSSRRKWTISLMILRITLPDANVLSPLVRGK